MDEWSIGVMEGLRNPLLHHSSFIFRRVFDEFEFVSFRRGDRQDRR